MKQLFAGLTAVAAGGFWLTEGILRDGGEREVGPIPQAVYVWQRVWNSEVKAALRAHPANSLLVLLGAELGWLRGRPELAAASLDYGLLRDLGRPVGLALRVGNYAGSFALTEEAAIKVSSAAEAIARQATAQGIEVTEFHLDFDCPESKLAEYRLWVEAVRAKVAPARLLVTALPSWLDQASFGALARASDGYVLQVHSLQRTPGARAGEELALCRPDAARLAVERAGRWGIPFQVALPTYGYVVGYDANGRVLGAAAEGPSADWKGAARKRVVRADATEMAELARAWALDRPRAMRSIIWYRLPVPGDNLNWRAATLRTVMAGGIPRARCRFEGRWSGPGLLEIDWLNDGDGDFWEEPGRPAEVCWGEARMVAGDAVNGFAMTEAGASGVRLTPREGSAHLRAGERKVIGWVRFDQQTEVSIE